MKFNVTGPDGLIDRKAPGQPSLLNATHRAALVDAIERGPIPAVTVVRWRIIDLAQMLWTISRCRFRGRRWSRELRAASARLPQAFSAAQASCPGSRSDRGLQKGGFAAELDKGRASLPRGTPIEVWFQML